jgi:hypothetical protein
MQQPLSSISSKLDHEFFKSMSPRAQKKLILFGPSEQLSNKLESEFFTTQGNKEILSPKSLVRSNIKFKKPDFGFNMNVAFDESDQEERTYEGAGWRRFMDVVSPYPKCERV